MFFDINGPKAVAQVYCFVLAATVFVPFLIAFLEIVVAFLIEAEPTISIALTDDLATSFIVAARLCIFLAINLNS